MQQGKHSTSSLEGRSVRQETQPFDPRAQRPQPMRMVEREATLRHIPREAPRASAEPSQAPSHSVASVRPVRPRAVKPRSLDDRRLAMLLVFGTLAAMFAIAASAVPSFDFSFMSGKAKAANAVVAEPPQKPALLTPIELTDTADTLDLGAPLAPSVESEAVDLGDSERGAQ